MMCRGYLLPLPLVLSLPCWAEEARPDQFDQETVQQAMDRLMARHAARQAERAATRPATRPAPSDVSPAAGTGGAATAAVTAAPASAEEREALEQLRKATEERDKLAATLKPAEAREKAAKARFDEATARKGAARTSSDRAAAWEVQKKAEAAFRPANFEAAALRTQVAKAEKAVAAAEKTLTAVRHTDALKAERERQAQVLADQRRLADAAHVRRVEEERKLEEVRRAQEAERRRLEAETTAADRAKQAAAAPPPVAATPANPLRTRRGLAISLGQLKQKFGLLRDNPATVVTTASGMRMQRWAAGPDGKCVPTRGVDKAFAITVDEPTEDIPSVIAHAMMVEGQEARSVVGAMLLAHTISLCLGEPLERSVAWLKAGQPGSRRVNGNEASLTWIRAKDGGVLLVIIKPAE